MQEKTCVNPEGSLTFSAKELLKILATPLDEMEISSMLSKPLFKIRSILREMIGANLIEQKEGKFVITEEGKKKKNSGSS